MASSPGWLAPLLLFGGLILLIISLVTTLPRWVLYLAIALIIIGLLWLIFVPSTSTPKMTLQIPEFQNGIPIRYTCDGNNIPPRTIEVNNLPPGTQNLALIMEDPDARHVTGTVYTHWVWYNIPVTIPNASSMSNAITLTPNNQSTFGLNEKGDPVYYGPCPPTTDPAHHYHFHLYALSQALNLPPAISKDQLRQSIAPYVLAHTDQVYTYQRS